MTLAYRHRAAGACLAWALLVLPGCEDDPPPPEPRELTREAVGHYCNMIVADHLGPKGQIFLRSRDEPIWFSSVRDTVAFTMLPEEPKDIAAIYVTDNARADWDAPGPGTWIDAREAWYVVGSGRVGGMGAPEAVPFSDRAAADAFALSHGGRAVAFTEIPESFILGGQAPPEHAMPDGEGHTH